MFSYDLASKQTELSGFSRFSYDRGAEYVSLRFCNPAYSEMSPVKEYGPPPNDLEGSSMTQFDRAEWLLGMMLDRFERAIAKHGVTDGLTVAHAKEAANLARAAATMASERRQLDKQARRDAAELQLPQVMAYLRTLPPDKRRHVIRELQDLDSGGSVLR